MNIVLIITAIILIVSMIIGGFRGLIKSIFSTFALIVALVLAIQLMPYGSKVLRKTPVYTSINNSIQSSIDEKLQVPVTTVSQQFTVIEQMPVPDFLKDLLKENNNKAMYEALGINEFSTYISNYITCLLINGISLIVLFVIIFVVIKLLGLMLDMLSNIPVLNGLNRVGGILFGLLNGVMILWVVCIFITLFSTTSLGQTIFEQINDSVILTFIYNNNLLFAAMANMTKFLM